MPVLYLLTLLLVFYGVASVENKTNAFGLSGTAAELRMMCHECTSTDYFPAYVQPLLHGWNVTDFGEFSNLPTRCDSNTAKQCGLGEICAKKQNLFVVQYQGNDYEFETAVHMCVAKNMHGTEEVPLSGQCYEEKSSSKKIDRVKYSTKWCYCRNEDYCNGSSRITSGLGLMMIVVVLLLL